MKNEAIVVAALGCCLAFFCRPCFAALVSVPDPALETAIQARIGDNGIAGAVDGDWLLGRDGAAGKYTGEPGGLTALGIEGETPLPVSGVHELTGLEAAANLKALVLHDSPIRNPEPILHLDELTLLGFGACGIDDAFIHELMTARFSLTAFALVNSSADAAYRNSVQPETLSLFLARHPGLRKLVLMDIDRELDVGLLAGMPRLADPPCQQELFLSQNKITSLEKLASFYDLALLELASCGITDIMLAQADWSRFFCLKKLNFSDNAITNIAPLLGLIATRPDIAGQRSPVTIDLRHNLLDAVSIAEHIPTLEQAGCEVLFEMALFLEVEGEGDLPPAAGVSWHPFGASVQRLARPRPDTNHGFVGWRGDVVTDDYSAAVMMTEHRRLSAVFSETPAPGRRFHALTLAGMGFGQGTLFPEPGRSLYRDGELIGIVATPSPGSYFGGWKIDVKGGELDVEDGARLRYEPSQAVAMVGDVTATAQFDLSGHSMTSDAVGMGTLSLPPGTYPLTEGAVLSLHALPEPGWRLRHWEDGSGVILHAPADDADPSLEVVVTEDITVRAVFEEAKRALTIVIEQSGGASGMTVPPGDAAGQTHVYPYGKKVKISARPQNAESAFAGWRGDLPEGLGRKEILKQHLVLPMTEERVITACFAPAEVTLSLDFYADGIPFNDFLPEDQRRHGFIRDPENEALINIDLKEMPIAFVRWEGDVPEGVDPSSYTIAAPMDRDRHLVAMLQRKNVHTINLSVVGNGKIIPGAGAYTVVPGRQMLLQAVPETGQDFTGWRIRYADGSYRALITPRISLNIIGNASIEAHFGEAVHRLWIGATAEGGTLMPPSGVYHVADEAVVDLEASPPEGSAFYYWATKGDVVVSELPSTRITVTEDASYYAVFGTPGARLVIEKGGEGSGEVTVFPEGGVVRPTGVTVELRATPDSDSLFARWEGFTIMGVNPTSPEIAVTLDQDRHLRAIFDKAPYTLTLKTAGLPDGASARMSPAPGIYGYRTHEEAVLFAAPPPDSGIAFVGWEGSLEKSVQPKHVAKMGQDRYVVARFAPVETVSNAVTLTVLPAEGDGCGTINPLSPGVYHFIQDTFIDLSFVLDGDSYFGGWTGDYAGDITYHNMTVALSEDRSVGARFTKTGALLTIGLNNEKAGAVSPPPGGYRMSHDMDIVLTATRINTQWQFAGWVDGSGRSVSPYARHGFRISSDITAMTLIAVFRRPPYFSPIEYAFAQPIPALRCNDLQ